MDCYLKRFFVVLILLRICQNTAASINDPIALPNCKDHCGDVGIPYPFGIGKGCYKDKSFEIVCRNLSEQLSVPFLLSIGHEVLSFYDSYVISEGHSLSYSNTMQILSPLKHTGCSNVSVGDSWSLNLTGSPFFISDNNKFTAIGCNNKALMKGTGLQIVGCEATCENETPTYKDDRIRNCVGNKCCQTTIPSGLQVFDATVEKLKPGNDSCQVAYLSHWSLDEFMFTPPELPEFSNYVMMDLNWYIDSHSIPLERTVRCERNSKGVQLTRSLSDLSPRDAYQCRCEDGYEGNPFLPGGCRGVCK